MQYMESSNLAVHFRAALKFSDENLGTMPRVLFDTAHKVGHAFSVYWAVANLMMMKSTCQIADLLGRIKEVPGSFVQEFDEACQGNPVRGFMWWVYVLTIVSLIVRLGWHFQHMRSESRDLKSRIVALETDRKVD